MVGTGPNLNLPPILNLRGGYFDPSHLSHVQMKHIFPNNRRMTKVLLRKKGGINKLRKESTEKGKGELVCDSLTKKRGGRIALKEHFRLGKKKKKG